MGFVVLLAKAMGTMDSEENQQLPLLRRPSGENEGVSGLSSVEVERILEHKPVPLRRYVRLVGWESRSLWLLSWASIIVSVCNYMLSFVSLTFSGQLGALELAGASIAMVGTQGLAYGIMLGMASAVQTVCGQAYGAKRYDSMGIICQRAIILHLGAAILLTFLYLYFGQLLALIGQADDIVVEAKIFARGMIPQLYAFAISCPMMRFLQAQNIVNPLAYMSAGVLLLHIFLTWGVVCYLGCGLLGAALTLSFSWWLLVLLQALYILLSPSCKRTWTGFSVKAVYGIWPYFKLTIASAVMLCLEIWYNQGLVLISGLLPNPTISLDSLSICAIVLIFQVGLSKLFTSDAEVIAAVSNLTPLLAISVFLNGIQPILSGVAIGSGWQAVVAYVNLTTYYVIGLPIGCVLGFKTDLGAAGLWWGMIIGVLLQTATLIFITARTNWNSEVMSSFLRIAKK
ncbi:hypothetical protein RHGRI_002144 [Rhododendron griersonianum]|uniref:Protein DETOXIFICATION n=1 Tax=Rhododendron griersonianum TaxID=479676 RepID=A0AAV6LQY6_9ERIC|nr:hypothetical protein RHGRI_002144 [Rhododendron griersonianum]